MADLPCVPSRKARPDQRFFFVITSYSIHYTKLYELVTARQIDRQLEGLGAIHREQRHWVRSTQDLVSRLDDVVALRGAALQSTAQKGGAELDPLEIDQYNELHVISRQLLESHADSAEFVRRISYNFV